MPSYIIVILLFIAALVAFILGFLNMPVDHLALVGLSLLTIGLIVERTSGTNRQP
jgi:hypothetical protein